VIRLPSSKLVQPILLTSTTCVSAPSTWQAAAVGAQRPRNFLDISLEVVRSSFPWGAPIVGDAGTWAKSPDCGPSRGTAAIQAHTIRKLKLMKKGVVEFIGW
jgi:hypothetical protein